MNRATKLQELPALTADLLTVNGLLIDNVFADLWREIGMNTILSGTGDVLNKRDGICTPSLTFQSTGGVAG